MPPKRNRTVIETPVLMAIQLQSGQYIFSLQYDHPLSIAYDRADRMV